MSNVERLIASYTSGEKTQAVDSNTNMQSTFINVAAEIKGGESLNKAKALFGETLGILLDIPQVVIVLKDEESDCYLVESCWGTFTGPSYLTSKNLPFQGKKYLPANLD